ncbi:ABC transporter permease [Micrococcus sp.]|uniref:ABC transporter permease n=1 Tax=Micrococcus sp. TaxID=1271 RepID=UPI002A9200AD|nr:ABC transporter permease [Micrococcus sp.]MDY6055037.1 ABC transporter permease [Micrococcus sp.]
MLTVALSQLRTQPRRYLAVVLAVLIGTGFLAAASLVGSTAQATLRTTLGAVYASSDLVVLPRSTDSSSTEPAEGPDPWQALGSLAGTPAAPGPLGRVDGVAEAWAVAPTSVDLTTADGRAEGGFALALAVPQDPGLAGVHVREGALPSPEDGSGVAVDEKTADRLGLHLGDRLSLSAGEAGTAQATVAGVVSASPDPSLSAGTQLWAGAALVEGLHPADLPPYASAVLLRLDPGADVQAVQERVSAAVGSVPADVSTPDEAVRARLAELSGGTDLFGWVLGGFAVLALLVTGLVIANTFQVLVAQRTRDLALLRAVGASSGQVHRSVLVEALAAGLLGAVLGVGTALGLLAAVAALARAALGVDSLTFAADPLALVLITLVGTAVAVVAAVGPARAATRVAPLQALRPRTETEVRSRAGRLRTAVGAVLAAGGTALMVWGALEGEFLAAMGGGVLSFLGVLMLATLFVPAAVRGAAVLARPVGVPGRLAGLNATRHRSRTAATAAALLIGTTLVALFITGGRTTQQLTGEALAESYPVDLVVSLPTGSDARQAVAAVTDLAEVDAAVAASPVGTTASGTPVYEVSPEGLRAVVAAAPQGQGDALGADGTVYTPSWSDPQTTVVVDGRVQDLTSVRGSGLSDGVFLSPATAEHVRTAGVPAAERRAELEPVLGPELDVSAVRDTPALLLVSAAGEVSLDGLQGFVDRVSTAAGPGSEMIGGGAPERLMYAQVIDSLLWIVVALLAASVLIALIGVANTLNLSVIERTRENALLRALGLTRGGLRGMIAIEAVLIAAVAAALGCALGVFYGWAGSQLVLGTLMEGLGREALVPVTVPWAELALIVAVAAGAGLLASLLPARRAARLSPVRGLASL